MLFGMIQFGVVFAGWTSLRNAVQTGARMAAIGDFGSFANQPASPAPCPALVAAEQYGLPGSDATADAYCAIVAQIGAPIGTAASSTAAPYPEVGLLVSDDTTESGLSSEVLTVCARVPAQNLTGLFNFGLSSTSQFLIEDLNLPANQTIDPNGYDPYDICQPPS
jgi:Flp pilus assembly protein TadG